MARQRLVASAALGAVLAEPTAEGAVEAGRELVRLWLKATELGLGLHPLGALPGLLCWLESEHTPVSKAVNDLAGRAREARGALGAIGPEAVHVVFRLIHAPIPSLRSLRYPVDRVLAIEPGCVASERVHSGEGDKLLSPKIQNALKFFFYEGNFSLFGRNLFCEPTHFFVNLSDALVELGLLSGSRR